MHGCYHFQLNIWMDIAKVWYRPGIEGNKYSNSGAHSSLSLSLPQPMNLTPVARNPSPPPRGSVLLITFSLMVRPYDLNSSRLYDAPYTIVVLKLFQAEGGIGDGEIQQVEDLMLMEALRLSVLEEQARRERCGFFYFFFQ